MSEAFNPEKVERYEPDEHCAGMMTRKAIPHHSFYYRQYVESRDYDKLLELYRDSQAKMKASISIAMVLFGIACALIGYNA